MFPDGGKLHIPATLQVGLAAKAGPGTITADVQHIFYSDTEGVGDPGTTGLPTGCFPSAPITTAPAASGPNCLGNSPGIGFGWDDMTVFKFGYTWSTGNDWTWRAGASFGGQPVQSEDVTFNIISPGVIEQHYTLGFQQGSQQQPRIQHGFDVCTGEMCQRPRFVHTGSNRGTVHESVGGQRRLFVLDRPFQADFSRLTSTRPHLPGGREIHLVWINARILPGSQPLFRNIPGQNGPLLLIYPLWLILL